MKRVRSMACAPRPGSRFLRQLVTSLVVFNLLVVTFAVATLRSNHGRAEQVAKVTTKNLCQALDQSLSATIGTADIALLAIKYYYEEQLAGKGIDSRTIGPLISFQFDHLRNIGSLRIADQSGVITHGIGVDPKARVPVADRDYYQQLRDKPDAGLVFSKPLVGRISHQWAIIFARRLNHPDGTFAGVVYGSLLLEQLSRQFATIDLGARGVISLRNDQLELIARYPPLGRPDDTLGKRQWPLDVGGLAATNTTEGTFFSATSTDNVARILSYRKLTAYPFYVMVGVSRETYLASWRSDFVKVSLVVLLSVVVSTLAGIIIHKTRQREREAERQLAREQERYRIVADNTFDWEFWLAPDGSVNYCSPSCESTTGRRADEFYADPTLFSKIVHPDDRPLLEAHCHNAAAGPSGGNTTVIRVLHADGSTRWVEHDCRRIVDCTGQDLGLRGSNRDVTNLTQAERARQEALTRIHTLEGIIPICSYCGKIRCTQNTWSGLERYVAEHTEAKFSHGICPRCFEEHRGDFE